MEGKQECNQPGSFWKPSQESRRKTFTTEGCPSMKGSREEHKGREIGTGAGLNGGGSNGKMACGGGQNKQIGKM